MGSSNGSEPSAVAVAAALGGMEGLLSSILAAVRSDQLQIAVLDGSRRELVLEQFPVAGSKRILAYRTGNGTDGATIAATPGQLLVAANEARLGMTWVNSGTNPVILYLSMQAGKGVPCVYLPANGGSWDGRFGNLPWAGHVWAVAQGGTTTLVGGEL